MDATIEVRELRKRYGRAVAMDGLSFRVSPGVVTGFLGPNGAGKSTTMRVILGLDAADAGDALIGGRPYRTLRHPLREVGALLDPNAVHAGRRARDHLLWIAQSNGIAHARVADVLDLVGLQTVAGKRVGGFSLGMRQRLGIAGALLGDPRVLLFDEPVNGLDPEGIAWIRGFLRTPAGPAVTTVLVEAGATVAQTGQDALTVSGVAAERIAGVLARSGLPFSELTRHRASLEQAYLQLTADVVDYPAEGSRKHDGVDR